MDVSAFLVIIKPTYVALVLLCGFSNERDNYHNLSIYLLRNNESGPVLFNIGALI